MKYQWKDLKTGMVLFRDRDEDIYNDEYFSYLEVLTVEELEDNEKKVTRQHIYVYGNKTEYEDKWAKEFNAGVSSPDVMWLSDQGWTTHGWHAVNFFTEQEIKRRVLKYCFNMHI